MSKKDELTKELEELDICYHKDDGNVYQKLLCDEVDALAEWAIARESRILGEVKYKLMDFSINDKDAVYGALLIVNRHLED